MQMGLQEGRCDICAIFQGHGSRLHALSRQARSELLAEGRIRLADGERDQSRRVSTAVVNNIGANSCGERRRQEQATKRTDADLPARHVVVCVGQASTRVLRRVLAGASKSQSVSHQPSARPGLPLHYSRPFIVMASSVLKQVCIIPDSVQHRY